MNKKNILKEYKKKIKLMIKNPYSKDLLETLKKFSIK